jgi:membrane protease YdiL (CAAX protease family)
LQNAAFFAVPVGYVRLKYRQTLAEIGLRAVPTADEWRTGLWYGAMAVLASEGIGRGLTWLAEANRQIPWVAEALRYEATNPTAALTKGLSALGPLGLIVAVVAVGIAPAFGEEMLFRGFVFNVVKKRWGLVAGVLISGVAFAVGHTYALGLVPVFLVGAAFALAYHRTGSLWVPVIMHALNNSLLVILTYFLPSGS